MSDDQEILAKIAQLQGRIAQHRQQPPEPTYGQQGITPPYYGRGGTYWAPQRGTPYGYPRGRGARAGVHQNRTLILNGSTPVATKDSSSAPSTPSNEVNATASPASGWVSKRERGNMQIINQAVYEQKSQEKIRAIKETHRKAQSKRDAYEKAKVEKYYQSLVSQRSHVEGKLPEVVFNGMRFQVDRSGNKLIRIFDNATGAGATPKQVVFAGVPFYRSKNGNLYRSGLVRSSRSISFGKKGLCQRFSKTGSCTNGPACPYQHDPDKIAICKDFLHTGTCQAGAACDLSHDPIPERVPHCAHFARGNCSNENCRYAHVRVSPGAPVCRAFAIFGYCDKGIKCIERHVNECPDYANTGECRNPKCRLPHVDRATQLKKNVPSRARGADEDASDVSSDNDDNMSDMNSEGIDSDDLDKDSHMQGAGDSHELSQQQDFVQFQ